MSAACVVDREFVLRRYRRTFSIWIQTAIRQRRFWWISMGIRGWKGAGGDGGACFFYRNLPLESHHPVTSFSENRYNHSDCH